MFKLGFLSVPLALALLCPSVPGLAQSSAKKDAASQDFSKEGAVIEQMTSSVVFQNDGTSVREQHARVRVQSDAGVQQYGLLRFPYQASVETVEIPNVRVTDSSGSVVATPPDSIQDVTSEIYREVPFYSDLREKHVAVKGLEPGGTLEYSVRWKSEKPLAKGQFWFSYQFTKIVVVLDEQLEISVPRERQVNLKSQTVQPTTREENGRRIYKWKTSNLESQSAEKQKEVQSYDAVRGLLSPPDVLISSFRTWDDVGRWYDNLQQEKIQPSPELKAKAEELTKGLSDDDAKLRAIYNYVSLRYRYVAIAFGIGRYQPHDAAEILGNQYGDCKDKHTLLAALLKVVGIRAYPALINSQMAVDADVPSPGQFDHVISVVPKGSTLFWMDTTPEVTPIGDLVYRLRGKPALVITPDKVAFQTTPANRPAANRDVYTITAKLDSDGTLEAHQEWKQSGDNELYFRYAFRRAPESQWKDLLQRSSYAAHLGATIGKVQASPPERTEETFTVAYDYTLKDFAGGDKHRFVLPIPLSLPSVKDEDLRRTTPLWLGYAGESDYESQIELPKGWSVTPSLPLDLKETFAEFSGTSEVHEGVLITKRHLLLKSSFATPDQLTSYQTFQKAISDYYRTYIFLYTSTGIAAASPAATPAQGPARVRTADHWADETLRGTKADAEKPPDAIVQNLVEIGEHYFDEGKYADAVIQYSKAIQLDSRSAQAHYQLSQAYLKLKDTNRAFQELTRTVDLAPDNYRAHTDLANLLDTVRNPDGTPVEETIEQAKVHLDILREKQPNNPETHEAWANYNAAQNNFAAAMQEMQQAIAADPNRSDSYLLLALFQLRSNLPVDAEKNFKKATEVDPKAMNAQLALGGFYQSRNRLPEAEQQFKHAIEVDPQNPAPRAAFVRLLMQEGKKAETETFLQQTKKDLSDSPEGYRMLGDFYATWDLDKAAAEYGSLYKDHPKDLQVKKNYIQLLILKSRLDEATKLDNEILKANPHDVEGLVYKAQVQLRRNDANGAVDSLQSALLNDPDNATAHYQLGLAFAQQHNDARAESEWREAVRLRPDLADALRALAAVEVRRGDVDAVLQSAQQIITAQPYSADGFILKGIADLARLRYSDAQQDAEQAMQRAPQSAAPYVQLGNIQLAQKHYAEAEKFYQQALDKEPSSVEGLSGLMNTYFAQKQYDQAIAAANAEIAKSPNNSNFYDLLGTALFNGKKDLPGAEAALRKAIELDKNNSDAIEKLGKVQVQEGAADKALVLYQQSIKDNPRQVTFYILSGELYEEKRDWDHAKAMYRQALSISPDDPLASNNLASVMLDQGGDVDVAMGLAQTARRGMPDSPNAADTLGWAYYQKGIYGSAISQFQEALRLGEKRGDPDDADVHYHLGLAYQKTNQNALAREQLEKAIALRPDHADALKALAELGD